jgi:hypothetical protein
MVEKNAVVTANIKLAEDKLKKKEYCLMFWRYGFFLSISSRPWAIGHDRLYTFCSYCYALELNQNTFR